MGDRTVELLDEVNQLIAQYRQEVPGRRRAWPESIKSRVVELRGLGLSRREIAKRTGISYFTIFEWDEAQEPPRFEPVAVVPTNRVLPRAGTVTVTKRRPNGRPTKAPSTVTVAMPSGIRIEGVDLERLPELLLKLERVGT